MNSINIVCHNVYPILTPTIVWGIGGMETRAALLARGLALSGRWKVRVIVSDFGQPNRVRIDGIEFDVYQPYTASSSNNVNPRFARRKWFPALNLDWRDIRSHLANSPDVSVSGCCQDGSTRSSGGAGKPTWSVASATTAARRRSSPTAGAGHGDSAVSLLPTTTFHLTTARTMRVSTTTGHRNGWPTTRWKMLIMSSSRPKASCASLEEPIRPPRRTDPKPSGHLGQTDPAHWPARGERDLILWIGRSDTFHKQPLLLLELAKRCPDLPFLMIMNRTHADVFDAVQAKRPANLTIVEWVPHREIWNYYRRARVFVSTSAYEGFPNTFLQCAVAGVPVASLTVDPEGILSRNTTAACSPDGNLDILERDVRSLWSDAEMAESYGTDLPHATPSPTMASTASSRRFESLLQKVIATPLRSSAPPWWYAPRQRFLRIGVN